MEKIIDLNSVFLSLNECCYGNHVLVQIGKIGLPIFIEHTGVPKQIGALQRRFHKIKWR